MKRFFTLERVFGVVYVPIVCSSVSYPINYFLLNVCNSFKLSALSSASLILIIVILAVLNLTKIIHRKFAVDLGSSG